MMNIKCVVCEPIDPLVMCSCGVSSSRRDFKGINYACFALVVSVFIASCSWVASRVEAAGVEEPLVASVATLSRDREVPPSTLPADPVPERLLETVRRAPLTEGYAHVPVGCLEVRRHVLDAGMPEWMSLVAWRESRCTPEVVRDDTSTKDLSFGYFQINTLGYLWDEIKDRCQVTRREELLDPRTNVRCAAALYRAYGYKPWDSGLYFN